MTRACRRLRRDESGQALVEFAIVTPLIVIIFMFAQWCWEIIQVKLKVQESARYAAWEATAYPLHDYGKGPAALMTNAAKMTTSVMADSIVRYADLDSSSPFPLGNRMLSATWSPPVVVLINRQEEMIYGGAIVNMVFNLGAAIFDMLSAMKYTNMNPVAQALIGSNKLGSGFARANRVFGSPTWGFNRRGFIHAISTSYVQNNWFNVHVGGKPLFERAGVLIMEQHSVLADSWRLNEGDSVGNLGLRPGVSKNRRMWKQVNRMYLGNPAAKSVAKGIIKGFKTVMDAALAGTMSSAPGLGDSDFTTPSVVSKNYGATLGGKARIMEDRGPRQFDTAPNRKEYQKTLKARGRHFMGCKQAEKLGCTDTLSQDNPFGDYIVRE